MSKRAPAPPPQIDGFEYISLIGSGGFADVFLYQQHRPRRRVAVKVLLTERDSGRRAAFESEADLMASLSSHPSIATIYEADIAQDGRPYLAMEYCPRPNLGQRYRRERFSVAEALRTTIQVAGAVETAHRAGIIHRDIKPANVLVTEYGHPALTDFGISATLGDSGEAEGMSIPWSPPEAFSDPPLSGVATDVWALAATLYTLLAGRTPFEVPGGGNTSADLVARITGTPLPPVGRSDLPPSLEGVLSTAMAKRPEARYPSALAFARALQRAQGELALAHTPVDVLDDSGQVHADDAIDDLDDDAPGTRLREVVSVDPSPSRPSAPRPPAASWGAPAPAAPDVAPGRPAAPSNPAASSAVSPATSPSTGGYVPVLDGGAPAADTGWTTGPGTGLPGVPDEETVYRSASAAPSRASMPDGPGGPEDDPRPRRRVVGLVVGGVVLAVVAVGVLVGLLNGLGEADDPTASATGGSASEQPAPAEDNLGDLVPPVQGLAGKADGDEAVFSWKPPKGAQDGDSYAWAKLSLTGDAPYEPTDSTRVSVPLDSGETCVSVVVVRNGKPSAQPQDACVTAP
ncbi:serine/threonine-protein kinase [Isoptericola sp. F-RaC21]|uniref:serine/threonine-protein kinase n=1 Tax=Isoptericola sp. F-RaC21 TaxID=3141452 RepID=UPI00315BA7B6